MKLNFINSNFSKTEIIEINENRKVLLAKLIGLLLTDGGLSLISGKRWRLHFTANSEKLVTEFQNLVKQLFNLSVAKDYRKGAWKVQVWISKQVMTELTSYSPTYRTLAKEGNQTEAQIPHFIQANNNLAKEFLRYAFTGDGTVLLYIGKARYGFRFDRCIKLYCEHPILRKQYFELLVKLNYKPAMSKSEIILRKPENIIRFAKEIGFVEGVEISGNGSWKGITKADLLRFAAKSYHLKPKALGKSKSDVHASLVKLILRSGTQTI